MSMHKIPLSDLELSGLKAHGLDIGKPSQLSDVFRQGIAWALSLSQSQNALDCCHDIYLEYEEDEVNKFAPPSVQRAWDVGKSLSNSFRKERNKKLKNFTI